MDLLKHVPWAFNGISYDTPDAFSKAILQYHEDIRGPVVWDPDEVVLETPSVRIVYQYYITPADVRFEDEAFLDEDEADVQINDPGEEDERREIAATFTADNGYYFTALELMYKLHQRLWHRQLGDHIFFEGLLACNSAAHDDPPQYYLHCGS